jgi:glycerol kinase
VDGGMSANRFFVQCLANFTGLEVTLSNELEATTRGAGLMALAGAGHLTLEQIELLWSPAEVFRPQCSDEARRSLRAAWSETMSRVEATIPELRSIRF